MKTRYMKRDYRHENRMKLLKKWRGYCQGCKRVNRRTDKIRFIDMLKGRKIEFEVEEVRGGFSELNIRRRSLFSYDVLFTFDDRGRLIRVRPSFFKRKKK